MYDRTTAQSCSCRRAIRPARSSAADELQRIVAECAAATSSSSSTRPICDLSTTACRNRGRPRPTGAKRRHRRQLFEGVCDHRLALRLSDRGCRPSIAEAMKIQDCMVICAPVPVQRAVAAVLRTEPDYPRALAAGAAASGANSGLRAARDSRVAPVAPAGGFFVMVRVEGCTDSRALAMELIEQQQVVTIPGRFFGESRRGLSARCRRRRENRSPARSLSTIAGFMADAQPRV